MSTLASFAVAGESFIRVSCIGDIKETAAKLLSDIGYQLVFFILILLKCSLWPVVSLAVKFHRAIYFDGLVCLFFLYSADVDWWLVALVVYLLIIMRGPRVIGRKASLKREQDCVRSPGMRWRLARNASATRVRFPPL